MKRLTVTSSEQMYINLIGGQSAGINYMQWEEGRGGWDRIQCCCYEEDGETPTRIIDQNYEFIFVAAATVDPPRRQRHRTLRSKTGGWLLC